MQNLKFKKILKSYQIFPDVYPPSVSAASATTDSWKILVPSSAPAYPPQQIYQQHQPAIIQKENQPAQAASTDYHGFFNARPGAQTAQVQKPTSQPTYQQHVSFKKLSKIFTIPSGLEQPRIKNL